MHAFMRSCMHIYMHACISLPIYSLSVGLAAACVRPLHTKRRMRLPTDWLQRAAGARHRCGRTAQQVPGAHNMRGAEFYARAVTQSLECLPTVPTQVGEGFGTKKEIQAMARHMWPQCSQTMPWHSSPLPASQGGSSFTSPCIAPATSVLHHTTHKQPPSRCARDHETRRTSSSSFPRPCRHAAP